MNIVKYLKQKGLKASFEVLYKYKLDLVMQVLLKPFLKNRPLENIIVIESHNDFDCNGGAFYDYLIDNGYNSKYKIVWLIKYPKLVPSRLPANVTWVKQYAPSWKKNYYRWIAKYFSADQDCCPKLREDQVSIYLCHGSVGLKDCSGVIPLPNNLDYCLTASEYFAKFDAKSYGWQYPDERFRICGFPMHDFLYSTAEGDLSKVIANKKRKVILWMPTFRIGVGGRNDTKKEQSLGIPLINTLAEYEALNSYLVEKDVLLVLKLHPKQDISNLKISNLSNIQVLTGADVKKKNVNVYGLMKDADALISDYSSAAYDFLHLNRPIAYDLSDLEDYTRGIIVKDPHELMAGHELKKMDDLYSFIDDVESGNDKYFEERQILFAKLYKYHDGNSSKRVAELLGL